MRPPGFWSRGPSHPAAILLRPVGLVYGALTAARMDRPGAAPPCPVICIGNFTLGGAGKTPTAIRIARMVIELGRRPAFLTRGYGGRETGPIAVDVARHAASDVGDEPLLLARQAPTVVARDRPSGARLCVEHGADVVVMDDGLQNPSLAKTLTLAVVDAASGIGNGGVFPAGPLRAPLDRQWRHIDGLVLIGDGVRGDRIAADAGRRGTPVHRARLVSAPTDLAGTRVFAFAGIGRPEKFFESLRLAGAEVVGTQSFPDHHPYRESELAALETKASRVGARLVTTEKDQVRLPSAMMVEVATLKVVLDFEDEASMRAQLADGIAGHGRLSRTD